MNRTELAQFAEQRFYALRLGGRKAVSAGRTTADAAEARVRDWLAIALLAGAEIDEVAPEVLQHSFAVRFAGHGVPPEPYLLGDAEAVASVAAAYSPDGRWRDELAHERDRALARLDAATMPFEPEPEAEQAFARKVLALCDLLGVPRWHQAAPLSEPERKAA